MGEAACASGAASQLVLFEVQRRDVTVEFGSERIVSDAGLLAVRKLDLELGVLAEAAARLPDPRSPLLVVHDVERLLVQQVYQLLAGWFDASDANLLRRDPLFQTLADVAPHPERPLASGSTISRFRYAYTRRQRQLPVEERTIEQECRAAQCTRIRAMNGYLQELFIKTRRTSPERIVIDFDATDDPAHGRQQLTFWHGHYDQNQYLAVLAFDGDSGFPLGAWLRPGTAHPSWGVVDELQEIVPRLRAAWPDVPIVLRGDGGFAVPELYEYCEREGLGYVIGFARNVVLERRTDLEMNYVRACAELHDESRREFFEIRDYQAGSWDRPRRIVVKCEITAQGGPNRRFVVTNLAGTPRDIYDSLYVARGDVPERRFQELKHGLQLDRLSSHRFFANAFTLQCHVLALALWTLFQAANADVPEVAGHTLQTVRERLFKAGAIVRTSTRRIWFALSSAWPGGDVFRRTIEAVTNFTQSLGRLWPDRTAERLAAKLHATATVIK